MKHNDSFDKLTSSLVIEMEQRYTIVVVTYATTVAIKVKAASY